MTKEKAITIIESHKAHWQRLLREKICDENEGRETIEGFDMAISALSTLDLDAEEAYCRGKIDGIKECTARLKKMNEALAKGGEET